MIRDAERRHFQIVIRCWTASRATATTAPSTRPALKKHGVRVVSAMENIGDSPEGHHPGRACLESMAEYYSANLSVNVKRGQRETLAKGRFCGGVVALRLCGKDGRLGGE